MSSDARSTSSPAAVQRRNSMMTSAARRCCCDGPQAAKELLHIEGRLERVDEIMQRGKGAYLADALLQGAGDTLMMKLEEAANRLARRARTRRSRVGPRCCEPQLHHPPVRRDQPRTDLAQALARSPGMEVILGAAVRGGLDHDRRRLRLTTTARIPSARSTSTFAQVGPHAPVRARRQAAKGRTMPRRGSPGFRATRRRTPSPRRRPRTALLPGRRPCRQRP